MKTGSSPKTDFAKLPSGFQIDAHLLKAEKEAEGIRFLAKVLGESGGQVFCETLDGIYEFRREDILEVKPLHRHRDMLVIRSQADFSLHSTLARLLRVERERIRRINATPDQGKLSNIDPVAYPGNHEWRGIDF